MIRHVSIYFIFLCQDSANLGNSELNVMVYLDALLPSVFFFLFCLCGLATFLVPFAPECSQECRISVIPLINVWEFLFEQLTFWFCKKHRPWSFYFCLLLSVVVEKWGVMFPSGIKEWALFLLPVPWRCFSAWCKLVCATSTGPMDIIIKIMHPLGH